MYTLIYLTTMISACGLLAYFAPKVKLGDPTPLLLKRVLVGATPQPNAAHPASRRGSGRSGA